MYSNVWLILMSALKINIKYYIAHGYSELYLVRLTVFILGYFPQAVQQPTAGELRHVAVILPQLSVWAGIPSTSGQENQFVSTGICDILVGFAWVMRCFLDI